MIDPIVQRLELMCEEIIALPELAVSPSFNMLYKERLEQLWVLGEDEYHERYRLFLRKAKEHYHALKEGLIQDGKIEATLQKM